MTENVTGLCRTVLWAKSRYLVVSLIAAAPPVDVSNTSDDLEDERTCISAAAPSACCLTDTEIPLISKWRSEAVASFEANLRLS